MRIEDLKDERDRAFCKRQEENNCAGLNDSETPVAINLSPEMLVALLTDLKSMGRLGELVIARSYWTHCFPMCLRDRAWYLLGIDSPMNLAEDEVKQIKRALRRIPLLPRQVAYHLPAGLVGQTLSDLVWERDHA